MKRSSRGFKRSELTYIDFKKTRGYFSSYAYDLQVSSLSAVQNLVRSSTRKISPHFSQTTSIGRSYKIFASFFFESLFKSLGLKRCPHVQGISITIVLPFFEISCCRLIYFENKCLQFMQFFIFWDIYRIFFPLPARSPRLFSHGSPALQ